MSTFSNSNGPCNESVRTIPGTQTLNQLLNEIAQMENRLSILRKDFVGHIRQEDRGGLHTSLQGYAEQVATKARNSANDKALEMFHQESDRAEKALNYHNHNSEAHKEIRERIWHRLKEMDLALQGGLNNLKLSIERTLNTGRLEVDAIGVDTKKYITFVSDIKGEVAEFKKLKAGEWEYRTIASQALRIGAEGIDFNGWKRFKPYNHSYNGTYVDNGSKVAPYWTLDSSIPAAETVPSMNFVKILAEVSEDLVANPDDPMAAPYGEHTKVKPAIVMAKFVDTKQWEAVITVTGGFEDSTFNPGRGMVNVIYSKTPDRDSIIFGLYVSSNSVGKKHYYVGCRVEEPDIEISLNAINCNLVSDPINGDVSIIAEVKGTDNRGFSVPSISVGGTSGGGGMSTNSVTDTNGNTIINVDNTTNNVFFGSSSQHTVIQGSEDRPQYLGPSGVYKRFAMWEDLASSIVFEGQATLFANSLAELPQTSPIQIGSHTSDLFDLSTLTAPHNTALVIPSTAAGPSGTPPVGGTKGQMYTFSVDSAGNITYTPTDTVPVDWTDEFEPEQAKAFQWDITFLMEAGTNDRFYHEAQVVWFPYASNPAGGIRVSIINLVLEDYYNKIDIDNRLQDVMGVAHKQSDWLSDMEFIASPLPEDNGAMIPNPEYIRNKPDNLPAPALLDGGSWSDPLALPSASNVKILDGGDWNNLPAPLPITDYYKNVLQKVWHGPYQDNVTGNVVVPPAGNRLTKYVLKFTEDPPFTNNVGGGLWNNGGGHKLYIDDGAENTVVGDPFALGGAVFEWGKKGATAGTPEYDRGFTLTFPRINQENNVLDLTLDVDLSNYLPPYPPNDPSEADKKYGLTAQYDSNGDLQGLAWASVVE
ncbi:MAG: hypothetical protein Pg6A_20010 [Termitinemataceae bacterium]|nr:MAG: hypothetical protein Pg6A_20010 [Termitinemataceae bacterium]